MKDNTRTSAPVPGPAYRLFEPFIGKWNTTGNMKAGKGKPDIAIDGTDIYEWLPGRFFILHTVNVLMGAERKESIEVIGFDAAKNSYFMHSYDNQGESGVMQASEHQGTWKFTSDSLRFTGTFSEDHNTISGIWESSGDDGWELLMNVKLTRAE